MNYYNEFDPKAAAWLRELIKEGHIPQGEVDTRSITEVSRSDLNGFTQCHFFAGIAGWPLALNLAGVDSTRPLWTGSCPCQPFSVAGKGKGVEDERHLWPVFANLIRECQPPIVFGEQVASKAGRDWLAGVFADLEGMGYAVAGADLCAAGVGAPHIRQRLYWVADANSRECGWLASSQGRKPNGTPTGWEQGNGESKCCGSTCGLAYANRRGNIRGDARSNFGPVQAADGRDTVGLEHPTGDGREQRGAKPSGRCPECGCCVVGLGDAIEPGLEGHAGHEPGREHADTPRPTTTASGAWDSFDLLHCTDGKTRRIESGSFPLAYGIPGRVGLLRGYGNAIVPQVAAEFIRAAII